MSEVYLRDNTRDIELMLENVQNKLVENQSILHAEIGEAKNQIK